MPPAYTTSSLASRILGGTSLRGGMPLYKYISNRFLTAVQNILLGTKLSEYHSGYRAFSAEVLRKLPLLANSDDFVFDNQIITQAVAFGFRIGEISCPTKYFADASSISFRRSVTTGWGSWRRACFTACGNGESSVAASSAQRARSAWRSTTIGRSTPRRSPKLPP